MELRRPPLRSCSSAPDLRGALQAPQGVSAPDTGSRAILPLTLQRPATVQRPDFSALGRSASPVAGGTSAAACGAAGGAAGAEARPAGASKVAAAQAAEPAARVTPRYPPNASIFTKLRWYGRIFLRDPGYVTALTMILMSQLGEGLMVGGFLMLIESLGIKAVGGVAPALIVALIEMVVGAACIPAAASNSEQTRGEPQKCAKQLVKGAAVDLAVGAMFVGVACLTFVIGAHAWPLVVAAAVVRVIQVARRSFRTNAWNGLKLQVMTTQQAREARDMRRIVGGTEASIGVVAFSLGSLLSFQLALLLLPAAGPAILITGLVCLGAGALMSAIPKLYFLKYAKPTPPQAAALPEVTTEPAISPSAPPDSQASPT